jgi:hypothetical protein
VVGRGPDKPNKNGDPVPLAIVPGCQVLPVPQRLPAKDPGQSIPAAKQDQVSIMQKTYRAIWAGILSDETIDRESRWIERLFHA